MLWQSIKQGYDIHLTSLMVGMLKRSVKASNERPPVIPESQRCDPEARLRVALLVCLIDGGTSLRLKD